MYYITPNFVYYVFLIGLDFGTEILSKLEGRKKMIFLNYTLELMSAAGYQDELQKETFS